MHLIFQSIAHPSSTPAQGQSTEFDKVSLNYINAEGKQGGVAKYFYLLLIFTC